MRRLRGPGVKTLVEIENDLMEKLCDCKQRNHVSKRWIIERALHNFFDQGEISLQLTGDRRATE